MMGLAGITHEAVNVFDVEADLKHYHEMLHEALDDKSLNPDSASWGPIHGDLLQVPLDALEPCDGLVSGPPCTPWANNGKRLGSADPRAAVFERIVEWVEHLALQGMWFFLLENSTNIAAKISKEEIPFALKIKSRLEARLPDWVIDLSRSSLESFLPVRRSRCWLRGMRRDMLPMSQSIPAPLTRIGTGPVALEHLLDPCIENCRIEAMTTTKQRDNTAFRIKEIFAMVEANPSHHHRIAVFDPHRAPEKKWKSPVHYDVVPVLRTMGPPYFVISLWDLDKPTHEKAFFRFLTVGERYVLQGHRAEYSSFAKTPRHALKMTGNAYAVPMLTAVLAPMLEVTGQSFVANLNVKKRRM